MVDVLSKLTPDILTLVIQLSATFIIYIMYKKLIHNKVMEYLKIREDRFQTENEVVTKLKEEKIVLEEEIVQKRKDVVKEQEILKEKLLAQTYHEIDNLRLQQRNKLKEEAISFKEQLEKDKIDMMKDLENNSLDLAQQMSKKILEELKVPDSYFVDLLVEKEKDNV